jgi:hypothetical protein
MTAETEVYELVEELREDAEVRPTPSSPDLMRGTVVK